MIFQGTEVPSVWRRMNERKDEKRFLLKLLSLKQNFQIFFNTGAYNPNFCFSLYSMGSVHHPCREKAIKKILSLLHFDIETEVWRNSVTLHGHNMSTRYYEHRIPFLSEQSESRSSQVTNDKKLGRSYHTNMKFKNTSYWLYVNIPDI